MVILIPRVKLNNPSLLRVHSGLPIDAVVVTIQDLISPITTKPNKTFFQIKEAGGIHAFLNFRGTIILSTIMKDGLLVQLSVEQIAEVIATLRPDECLTIDAATYEGQTYWVIENGIPKLCYDNIEISRRNIQDSCSKTRQLMTLCPQQKFVGLVKGSTSEQIIEHAKFFRDLGITKMAFHTADFFRNGSPAMISRARLYAELVRKEADYLMLMGMGSQSRLLEFSFANSYVSFGHFVTAKNGKMFVGTKKADHGGYSTHIVRENLIQMIRNIKELESQKKIFIGGVCPWEEADQANELYIQVMPEREAIMLP